MIDIRTGQAIHVVPPNFQNDPKVIAFCYAIDNATKKLMDTVNDSLTWSNIDFVPAERLDYLATELRTPFYSSNLQEATKREMIKRTLGWYSKLGTPGVVKEIITAVFGTGELSEWFEYDGTPYTFRITTSMATSPDQFTEFMQLLQRIKNTRSQLEKLTVRKEFKTNVYIGAATRVIRSVTIKPKTKAAYEIVGKVYIGTASRIIRQTTINSKGG